MKTSGDGIVKSSSDMMYSDGPMGLEGFFAHAMNNSEWPVMQYTGLNDKNGKEIYEGDIISYRQSRAEDVVTFQAGQFGVAECPESQYGYLTEGKIIGNIYEGKNIVLPILSKTFDEKKEIG